MPIPPATATRLTHHALGEPSPQSQHAVIVNLPTLEDVIGYEERRTATMSCVRTGYPRFLRHPLVAQAACHLAEAANVNLAQFEIFPIANEIAAQHLIEKLHLQTSAQIVPSTVAKTTQTPPANSPAVDASAWALLCIAKNNATDDTRRVAKYVQHTGLQISSRRAEDWLHAQGLAPTPIEEPSPDAPQTDNVSRSLQNALSRWLEPAAPSDIYPCASGMNALYAALETIRTVQNAARRSIWLQLGWLYTDTLELLRKSLLPSERLEIIYDVLDQPAIDAFFARHGANIAGIVTEAPTNPLLRTANLRHLRQLADQHGALLLIDPSTAGLPNTQALPYADILAVSLTKYTATSGDVMLGALAINPNRRHAPALTAALQNSVNAHLAPAYPRDAKRLLSEMRAMEAIAARVNANTAKLVEWLSAHPRIQRVRWAMDTATAENYAQIARTPTACGSLISIELKSDFAKFHDTMRAVKGPSFGTHFTIVSPYIYMAHYDLVCDTSKHPWMRQFGIPPELIRISVGAEPFDEIRDAFAEALNA